MIKKTDQNANRPHNTKIYRKKTPAELQVL